MSYVIDNRPKDVRSPIAGFVRCLPGLTRRADADAIRKFLHTVTLNRLACWESSKSTAKIRRAVFEAAQCVQLKPGQRLVCHCSDVRRRCANPCHWHVENR